MPVALRLEGELDVVALRAALQRVVERHEVLRTRFEQVDGVPMQRIDADAGFVLVEEDARAALVASSREAVLAQVLEAESQRPFDLARGPLIRGRLVRLGQAEHLLLVNQHHIVSDGWSQGILMREVSQLYAALSAGEADPLDPLPIQYLDYAMWQRDWLQGEVRTRQLDYWRGQLSAAPGLLELPTDRPRPALQSYAGCTQDFVLEAGLVKRLRTLSQLSGTTLFMTLLAGWSVLLSRLSGQAAVVVGTPVANRPRRELEGLIGFFVNTLALRVDVDGEESVATLLARVKAVTLGGYEHQDLPFEQVVEALQPARALSHSPVFQAMLTLDNTPREGEAGKTGLRMGMEEWPRTTTQFDLSLSLVEAGEAVVGGMEYASDLFDAATIIRWLGYLTRVLEGMAANAEARVGDLALLDAAERQQLLEGFNGPLVSPPESGTLAALFERQVQRNGDAIALVSGAETLSYAALNRRANQVAHRLRALGVGPESRVGLCAERSVELLVGILGILKAGGGYVPLDPGYPEERLRYMVEDSRPAVLLRQGDRARAVLADLGGAVQLDLDAASTWAAEVQTNPEDVGVGPENLAYVIYTSGSTGRPKGVMVEQRNVLNLVDNHIQLCSLDSRDRVLQYASSSFDTSVEEIFPTFAVGATLILRPDGLLGPGRVLEENLQTHAVTVLDLPTAFWHEWVRQLGESLVGIPAALRLVVVGGEKVNEQLLREWRQLPMMRQIRWLNTYGPTETTVYATAMQVDGRQAIAPADFTIGRPILNTEVFILDDRGAVQPIGVAGEICIGGHGVARGYQNRPDLTAERFLAHSLRVGGGRLYRSGDIGRWREDGTIEFLGRRDAQVKLRGYRIELGEIEAALGSCAGVREAVVEMNAGTAGSGQLVAYCLIAPDQAVPVTALRDRLHTILPAFMVPSVIATVTSWPLTPSGKLDRKAMAQTLVASRKQEFEAPEGEIEQAIADVWTELLGVSPVGRRDHFFEIGGHSLLAVRLVVKLQQMAEIDLSIRDVFEVPRLCDLAERVLDRQLAQFDTDQLAELLSEQKLE